MSEKPIAMLVAALAIAPMCALCLLGPAVIAGFFAGWFGWLADLSIGQGIALALGIAACVAGLTKFRRIRHSNGIVSIIEKLNER